MAVQGISDIDIHGKRVFFRFDFNVPLDDEGNIKDDTRVRRALPTINYAVEQGARLILSSHLGRPKGERKPELSLRPVAARLTELLDRDVQFIDDCIGPKVEEAVGNLAPKEIILLENLRFHKGEKDNDEEFARRLARLADVYVNDAFGTAHRAHASTDGITRLVSLKAAGLLMKEELEKLDKAFSNPRPPVIALFGGAKVSDKLGVLKNLLDRMQAILIGGGMANTFLKAKGTDMGKSKTEDDLLDDALDILSEADNTGCRILLPTDVVTATEIDDSAKTQVTDVNAVPSDSMALDIGPETIMAFSEELRKAGTIVWNGPMGVFEMEPFKTGTADIAEATASASAFSVIGGGDTVRAVSQFGVADRMSYISTGGGAFMEFMEGKTLPGVAALES